MLNYLLIFIARVCDVSLTTIRTLMVVQGRRVQAAILGFFEVIIYIIALGKVVSGLNDPRNLLAYALGFASGNYIGILIEEKIALGNLTAQVILKSDENSELINELREKGFGLTVLDGHGREGARNILLIIFKRKNLAKLREILHSYDEDAFITVSAATPISGGYFPDSKRK